MNLVDFRDLALLDAALERSQRLWPDPFEAPEVPPRDLLEAYRRGPEHLPEKVRGWLPAQIAQSVNCQRAVEMLRAEGDPGHVLHPLISSEEERRLALPNLKSQISNLRSEAARRSAEEPVDTLRESPAPENLEPEISNLESRVAPEIDQVWTTKADVQIFNGQNLEPRRVWRPMNVLLAEGPIRDAGETIWRAMPCTPLWVWGEENVGDSEAVVNVPGAGDYVVHFRLEYPVSARQLHACIGVAEDRDFAPGNAPSTPELELERERVVEFAAWLSATADARRALREWQADMEEQEQQDVWRFRRRMGLVPVEVPGRGRFESSERWHFRASLTPQPAARKRIEDSIALAAKTPGSLASQAVLVRGRPEELVEQATPVGVLAGSKPACILLEPTQTTAFSGSAFARWDVSELVPELSEPRQMVVLSPTLDSILANGYVHDGVAIAVGCDWEECRKTIDRWEDWLILIFDPK